MARKGINSSLPTSMSKIQIAFDTGCKISKEPIGPITPNPGPTLPRDVMQPVTPIIVEFSSIDIKKALIPNIKK